jgi:hypothetical protein
MSEETKQKPTFQKRSLNPFDQFAFGDKVKIWRHSENPEWAWPKSPRACMWFVDELDKAEKSENAIPVPPYGEAFEGTFASRVFDHDVVAMVHLTSPIKVSVIVPVGFVKPWDEVESEAR